MLEPGVKEMLLADTRDFLRSEKVRFVRLIWKLHSSIICLFLF